MASTRPRARRRGRPRMTTSVARAASCTTADRRAARTRRPLPAARSWRVCSRPARRSRATCRPGVRSRTCATRTSWPAPRRSRVRSKARADGRSAKRSSGRRGDRGADPRQHQSRHRPAAGAAGAGGRSAAGCPGAAGTRATGCGICERRSAESSRKRRSDDASEVYRAIRLANPGGLGSAEEQDVAAEPTITLLEAMRLAADRDGIARE